MKIKILLTLTVLALAASTYAAVTPFALTKPINVFGVSTTNANVATSYAVIPARSENGGAPVVTFLDVASDKAGSFVQFYKVTAQLQVNFTNSTTTLFVQNTNNSGANWQSGSIVIRHIVDDSYEKRTLAANSGATNIIVTVAPMGTVVPGDQVYYVSTAGAPKIAWGAVTNTLGNGAPLIAGQPGLPLLVEVDLTSNGGLYSAGGVYAPLK